MTSVRVEFTVEPFEPGALGPHVRAAIDAAALRTGEVDVGPFASTAVASSRDAAMLVHDIVRAALVNGATRVAVQVETVES